MFTYPFQIFKKRATDLIPELREIDFYIGQDSITDKNTLLFAAPALFFEFDPGDEVIIHGNRMRSVVVNVNMILVTENVTDNGTKRMKKDSPLDHMRLFDKVNKTFQGFGSLISYLPEFAALFGTQNDMRIINSLTPNGVTSPHSLMKGKMRSTQSYQCIVYDHSACKYYSVPPVQPTLDVTVNFD